MIGEWICPNCGYVYEEKTPYKELPDDWVCPICGEPKASFIKNG